MSIHQSLEHILTLRMAQDAICGICQRQIARYSCPKCNLRYCSSTCYRSEKHDTCSENFFRQTLLSEIHSDPSRSFDEKREMLEMLKRLEGEDLERDELEKERQGLENRLEGLNLDTLDSEQLFDLLSPSQRTELAKLLKDPHLTKELLDEELLSERLLPWWEDLDVMPPTLIDETQLPKLPEKVLKSASKFVPNILAVILAYVYVTRTYPNWQLESDTKPLALSTLKVLVPFIFTISDLILQDARESLDYVFSRIETSPSYQEKLVYHQDLLKLLHSPPLISSHSSTPSSLILHSQRLLLTALSDLVHTLPVKTQAYHKISFYISLILKTVKKDWESVEEILETELDILALEIEEINFGKDKGEENGFVRLDKSTQPKNEDITVSKEKVLIEEIG